MRSTRKRACMLLPMASQVEKPKPHVVIFPFMAHGHTLPLLDLSKALSHRHNIKVTIISTPSNSISISNHIANFPFIDVVQIPFPSIPGLPEGCENTAELPSMDFHLSFLLATKHLQKPFERVLHQMSKSKSLPICVISDFFLAWTLASCKEFGIPRLVFHGMGVFSMAASKTAWVQADQNCGSNPNWKAESDIPLYLPGIEIPFVLTGADMPEGVHKPHDHDHDDDPYSQFVSEAAEAEFHSWGVVVNSFLELEGNYVASLESFYQDGAKAWCVGPLCVYDKSDRRNRRHDEVVSMKWLADQHHAPASVIFVCFGTQAHISPAQLDEVAYGLEEAGVPFLWVVRSNSWSLPDGLEERLKGKGLITRQWVDQPAILKHSSIGGFLTHCGWNSVLESLSAGVPILAWPMIAEQTLNAKFVVEGLHAGVELEKMQSSEAEGVRVSRGAICRGVKELMEGRRGRIAREKSQALGGVARQAVEEEGGSSYHTLTNLIHNLCACI